MMRKIQNKFALHIDGFRDRYFMFNTMKDLEQFYEKMCLQISGYQQDDVFIETVLMDYDNEDQWLNDGCQRICFERDCGDVVLAMPNGYGNINVSTSDLTFIASSALQFNYDFVTTFGYDVEGETSYATSYGEITVVDGMIHSDYGPALVDKENNEYFFYLGNRHTFKDWFKAVRPYISEIQQAFLLLKYADS